MQGLAKSSPEKLQTTQKKVYTVYVRRELYFVHGVQRAAVDVFSSFIECDARPGNKRLAAPASAAESEQRQHR